MFLVTSSPIVTAGFRCAPEILPNTYIHIITVRPNTNAIAIQSPKPPRIPIPTFAGSMLCETKSVTTAEPVPKNTRKKVPKSSAKNFFLMLQVI